MIKKYLLPFLALLGSVIALFVVIWSQHKPMAPPIPFPASTSPYVHAIYGAGLIEASSENIAIGIPFSLPIDKVFVVAGDRVQPGTPLLQLDTRSFEAQRQTALSQRESALIRYENASTQFSFYERLQDLNAVSEQALTQAYYAMLEAQEAVYTEEALLQQIETDILRATVCSPVEAQVLQVNVHSGEIYPLNSYNFVQPYVNLESALILLGSVSPMQMRIDIDEEDAWRFCKGAPATAFVRGNPAIHFPLRFVRIEPYILPKTSFTGSTIERIDTRVLQVIYQFDNDQLPVYAGQLLDVYIEAPPLIPNMFQTPASHRDTR